MSAGDRDLIQIVDTALAEATRRSGVWLVCKPGCMQCCIGPFEISQLDARRLRAGLAELDSLDPARAARVRSRAREHAGGDDDLCPALDPEAGTCDLYAARPITCRAFGPPMRCGDEAIGICELCFEGATDTEIAACETDVDPDGLEAVLIEELESATGSRGPTSVALALVS